MYTPSRIIKRMFASPTDEQLAHRAATGNQDAISLLFERYSEAIYRFCFFQLRDSELASDLTQDTFIEMVHSLKTFSHTGSFKNWLYMIAKRQILHAIREKYECPKAEFGDWLPDESNANWIDEKEQQKLREETVATLLSTVSPIEAQILQLLYCDGYTSKEAATVTGKTPESVRVIAHRAIGKLRKKESHD
ncbi:hypothetical protein C5B42_05180 [Candidatus Cerribacteria bacterium 'Amazon FNV 2010 28 9']|uniref:RNA polymerase subunit sigma-24 n=1 Tax=Candidatus Cerribacteria bacterium 'Amazon FNV 2010 28 9' TaxID=2081795 RepID=A0A317JRL3_9BACT|nr:MAG: hypothetical protein C5B42_05180 [Candidatus Cerribacteria bacterium 'Amazon FNV 2010 28 9']